MKIIERNIFFQKRLELRKVNYYICNTNTQDSDLRAFQDFKI
jgi:hypothetical protein